MPENPIAIVGAACRFPGAPDLDAFWDLLIAGRDAIQQVTDDRWSTRLYVHPERNQPGKTYTCAAGLIEHIDQFDAEFFGISPREALQMDPQQRLLLEVSWAAIEDAGLTGAQVAGSGTGVYVGASAADYANVRMGDPSSADAYFMTGNTLSIFANRLSYIFDLHGPSLTVDTACSSSLVALHLACEALREGRIDQALVGGVNLLLSPVPFVGFAQASMLSRKGRCFAFDKRADGYVRAEGGAVIILKPLAAALADGDTIRGVIHGTGVNSDGRTIGLSLPNSVAQAELLRTVYGANDIAPDALAFFEAHGTGTPAGDPIETGAISEALARHRTRPLPIGSVKTNVGHLEAASGMAGLLKTMLALEHRVVPRSLNFEEPNPNIRLRDLNLDVVTAPLALPDGDTLPLAGVNSFGFGGTNAHAVLGAAPAAPPARAEPDAALPPLLLSARAEAALKSLARAWSDTLAAAPAGAAPGLIRAAARKRDHHAHRLAARAAGPAELAQALRGFADGQSDAAVLWGSAVPRGQLAFVFSGNGSQWAGMARDALKHSAAFRAAIEELDGHLAPALGWSVKTRLESDDDAVALARTETAQPLLFAVQVGIVAALRAAGIDGSACLGHSVGEVAAAWAAGALTLADAARVIVARSRQQQRTEGRGRMAAVHASAEAVTEAFAVIGGGLEIAAINTPKSVTVAGPETALKRLQVEAERQGWIYTPLDLNYAFHSAAMDPFQADLIADLDGLTAAVAERKLISTVAGGPVDGPELGPEHWWQNIRDPVRFADSVDHLIAAGYRIFLEIGPHATLQSYLRDGLRRADSPGRVLSTLSRRPAESDPFATVAANCYVAGFDISRAAAFDGATAARGLPAYPWQRKRHWWTRTQEATDAHTAARVHPLLGFKRPDRTNAWFNHVDTAIYPWLADHAVEGTPVLPAAAVVELALAAAQARAPSATCLEVSDLEIRRPLVLEPEQTVEIQTTLGREDGGFELASRPRLAEQDCAVHAVARVGGAPPAEAAPAPLAATVVKTVEAPELYAVAARLGLNYGPHFQAVERVEILGPREAVVRLDAARLGDVEPGFLLHPALLDGALQGLVALLAEQVDASAGVTLLPWRFGRIRLFELDGRMPAFARLKVGVVGSRSASADIELFDAKERPIAQVAECWFRRVRLTGSGDIADRGFYFDLVPAPLAGNDASPALDLERARAAASAALGPDQPATEDATLLIDAFIAAAARDALTPLAPHGSFTPAALIEARRIAPGSGPLAQSLLEVLERHEGAAHDDGAWHLVADAPLPAASEIWRSLLADQPELVGDLALLGAATDTLGHALAEGTTAFDIQGAAILDHFLYASPAGARALDGLAAALEALAAQWPAGRPLRILEVGARSGIVAGALLRRIDKLPVALSYLATDPDPDLAAQLATLRESHAGVATRQWDPRHDNAAAALNGARFDVVVAVHALGRLGFGADALAALAEVVAPGGCVMLVEAAPNPVWDFVFGQDAAWWRASLAAEFPVGPLRDAGGWQNALIEAGFQNAATAALAGAPWPVSLVVAEAAGARADADAETGDADAPIVLIGEPADPLVVALASHFAETERRCTVVAPPKPADGADLGAALRSAAEHAQEVVVLPPPLPASFDAVRYGTTRLATLTTVAKLMAEARARLWVVTRQAQQPAGTAKRAAAEGALGGLARVIANEIPRLACRIIDLPEAFTTEQATLCLARELAQPDDETEVAWTPLGRHALRLRRGVPAPAAAPAPAIRLTMSQPGRLHSLRWAADALRTPGPGQVAVDVRATGLNFRDVMWAMGLIPEEALLDGFAGPTLGLECSGVVTAVGAGVTAVAPGDRVMAFAPASLGSQVITAEHAVAQLPEGIDFATGATIPVAFITAVYSLGTLAQLGRGERVLIHGGAGGLGIAAIQYAKHRGAEIFATAGSPLRRAFLRELGVDHVLNSRSLSFADEVMAITGGEGVDVVLNSLSGEAMERSLGLLRRFGRFVEVGKVDFYMNTKVGLRPLRHNVSYHAVDVDQLPVQRPELARLLMSEVAELLTAGALRPLPLRVFPFSAAVAAFRLMQSSGHIGKIVLVPDAEAAARTALPPAFAARPDGTYVVTGGLAGFGLETVRWLVGHGARHVALIGRRGLDTPGAADAIAELERTGVTVKALACDVADRTALRKALGEVRASMPAIRGVVHAAMVVDDALISDLDGERFRRVLAPKLGGAEHLDALTRKDPVELFLLFSSATTLLGAPGQASYVAANAGLEALARRRHAEGLPATAVAWGPISDAGYLARSKSVGDALARRLGAVPLGAAASLDSLPALIASGQPMIAFAEVNWGAARRHLPTLAAPMFASLVSGAQSDGVNVELRDRLANCTAEEAQQILVSMLRQELGRILRLAPESIDPHRSLSELGMDSLMGVELRLAIESSLKVDLPLLSLAEMTLSKVAARLASNFVGDGAGAAAAPEAAASEDVASNQVLEALAARDRAGDRLIA
jgi:acyl transferase domain-containing protein/acyl carrier protein